MKIIGDVHGYHDSYLNLATKCNATVQVGDFGFDYSCMSGMDPDLHKIIGGNHDNYEVIGDCPNYLGDFGTANVAGVEFFFIRGERSVDAHLRIEGENWWRQEELDIPTGYKAIEAYENNKPEIVISHGCPASILPAFVTNPEKYHPSRTAQLLQAMLEIHRPKMWIFGHHHNSHNITENGTFFRCLNELEIMEI